MYQSPEHEEVVIVEIKRGEPPNDRRTVRLSLGDGYSEWTKEILTTSVLTGGSNVSSDNVKAKWQTTNTLTLCLFGDDENNQTITLNVLEKSHSLAEGDCPL